MPDYPTTYATRAWAVCLLLSMVLWSGCGKKAPPIAPRQPAMAAVADLSARYENNSVMLSWHHPASPAAVNAYLVFKARKAGDGSTCKGCPILFEKAGTCPLDPEKRNTRHLLSWAQSADSGFQYTFKVVPVQSSGARGPDSNFAVVNALH